MIPYSVACDPHDSLCTDIAAEAGRVLHRMGYKVEISDGSLTTSRPVTAEAAGYPFNRSILLREARRGQA